LCFRFVFRDLHPPRPFLLPVGTRKTCRPLALVLALWMNVPKQAFASFFPHSPPSAFPDGPFHPCPVRFNPFDNFYSPPFEKDLLLAGPSYGPLYGPSAFWPVHCHPKGHNSVCPSLWGCHQLFYFPRLRPLTRPCHAPCVFFFLAPRTLVFPLSRAPFVPTTNLHLDRPFPPWLSCTILHAPTSSPGCRVKPTRFPQ